MAYYYRGAVISTLFRNHDSQYQVHHFVVFSLSFALIRFLLVVPCFVHRRENLQKRNVAVLPETNLYNDNINVVGFQVSTQNAQNSNENYRNAKTQGWATRGCYPPY